MENESDDDIDEEHYSDDNVSVSDFLNDSNQNTDFLFETTDTDNNNVETEEFNDNNQFDDSKIMFETSKLTINDVMTLIMAFSIRFKLPDLGISELINMVKFFSGRECNDINITKYRFKQKFDPPDETVMYHYYCMNCKQKILYSQSKEGFKKQKNTFATCEIQCEITPKSKNYFMSIDFKYQLKMMFHSKKIKKEIFDFINMDVSGNDKMVIKDIHYSELYKKINGNENIKYITYNLSTDGAPLTKSGKRGFWPLQIILNCLPTKRRFKYPLFCGMLTCTEEPNIMKELQLLI